MQQSSRFGATIIDHLLCVCVYKGINRKSISCSTYIDVMLKCAFASRDGSVHPAACLVIRNSSAVSHAPLSPYYTYISHSNIGCMGLYNYDIIADVICCGLYIYIYIYNVQFDPYTY